MLIQVLRAASLAAGCVLSLSAQTGNEVVFVGTSTSGSTDRYFFVESASGATVDLGGLIHTDNVSGAVWADTGRNLYVTQSLQNQVSRAAWNGATPAWSTFYSAPGACYGVGYDLGRRRLWVLTGASASGRELHCLDADPDSPGYGSLLAQTSTLSTASRERWRLSFTGNLAAVPHVFLSGGLFEVVDLDPQSATFGQPVVSTPVPNAAGGFSFASACEISTDDAYAYLLYAGIGTQALAVWDLGAGQWLDFDPAAGQQDFVIPLAVPNTMAVSLDRSFALIAGQGGGGWVMRVDFDYQNPTATVGTQFPLTGLVPNCNAMSLAPDQTRCAVSSTPVNLQGPSHLTILDVNTGAVLQTTTLANAWNVYTTAWQDASPIATWDPFGAGCVGTVGTPGLAALAGTRPALGGTLQLGLENLPFGVGLMLTGLSSSLTSTGLPLPLDLGFLGMPGCALQVDPAVIDGVVGVGQSGVWSWTLPATPSLFGLAFFNQGLSLDPAANAFGLTVSNAGIGILGY